MPPMPADFTDPAILRHLGRQDPVLRGVIRRHGACTLVAERASSPFRALVRAVAHQQLNGTAATTILGRFTALFPGKRFPGPADLAAVSDLQLRAVGFSNAKVAAIRDLAARTLDGTVPSARAIARLGDDEIVERLTAVRGVGRWTVEMLLMFKLGRPDVLPADDFGVRNGFRIAYGLTEMPKPKVLLAHGERWRPWRSVAAWYLWRAVDMEKAARTAQVQ
jgi:DNA-3-methyladenine glycosylase II